MERTKGNILFVVVPRVGSMIFQETLNTFQKINIIMIIIRLPIIPATRLQRELRSNSWKVIFLGQNGFSWLIVKFYKGKIPLKDLYICRQN